MPLYIEPLPLCDAGDDLLVLDAIPQHAVDPDLDQSGSALAGVACHVI